MSAGITTSTSKVANAIPQHMVIAMGTIKRARLKVSNINGPSPAIVVSDVKITARNRERDASWIASLTLLPSANERLKKLIKMMESLTTMPVSEKNASMDIAPISASITQWPTIAPVRPSGIALITASGQRYEEKDHARIR
jgi:hypothetical protein